MHMGSNPQHDTDRSTPGHAFATTRWSLVAAGGQAAAPLTELCVRYWYPVFAYARRCGHPPEVAQEITQAFFHHLVGERLRAVGSAPPRRFREWLLAELARFVAHDWRGQPVAHPQTELLAPLPAALLEQRHRAEGMASGSADLGFRRSFALEVLSRAHNRLRREAQQAGREAMFERLQPFLTTEPAPGEYAALAEALATSPLALVVALKRLRQRFRELADEELAETVSTAEEFEAERAALHSALRHGQ
jgi:RNA polymerase sigma-70 factor (ECF subfamily)